MSTHAVIGDASASATFSVGHRSREGRVEILDVAVRAEDLEASKGVHGGYGDGSELLVRFFEDLATSWRGWDGERVYESIEHDLRIAATHDGHVRLAIELSWQHVDPGHGWRAEIAIRLDAGEELTRAAQDLSTVVRG